MYTDEIQKKRADAKAKQQQDAYQKSVADLAANVTELLNSLEKTGAKKLDADFIQAVKQLSSIASSLSDVKVSGDMEMKRVLTLLTGAIKNIDAAPIVQVTPTPVKVTETKVDLSPVTDAIKALSKQAKPKDTQVDFSAVTDAVKEVTSAINGLSFPVPNYVLPFKGTNGDAAQVQLDASGNVPVSGTVSIDTTGLATSAKQDTGNTSLSNIDTNISNLSKAEDSAHVSGDKGFMPLAVINNSLVPLAGTAGDYIPLSTDSNGALFVKPYFDGGTQEVSAFQGGSWTVSTGLTQPLTDTQLRASAVPVSLASVPSHAVTNAGTFAVQNTETRPATPTLANVTMTGSSVTLQASNTSRRNLMIFNDSGVVVYVKLGSAASSTSFTVKLVDQAYYELPAPVYTGIVTALGASGSVRVTEVV